MLTRPPGGLNSARPLADSQSKIRSTPAGPSQIEDASGKAKFAKASSVPQLKMSSRRAGPNRIEDASGGT